jgi:hypothetical protein
VKILIFVVENRLVSNFSYTKCTPTECIAALISFIVECINKYESKLSHPVSLHRLLELCLIVAWLLSHDQFHAIVFQKWSRGEIPVGNLALAYAKEMYKHGGCNGGDCNRFQPHFNKDINLGQLVWSLVSLRSIVSEINESVSLLSSNTQTINAYTKAVKDCKNLVIGAGGLTAQHLIHILVFTGALQVPPFLPDGLRDTVVKRVTEAVSWIDARPCRWNLAFRFE